MNDAIDSSRRILGEEMKVNCPLDDVADCLASFVMRIRANPDYLSYIDEYQQQQRLELNDSNRCSATMDPTIGTRPRRSEMTHNRSNSRPACAGTPQL
jgi:hypothetical protein